MGALRQRLNWTDDGALHDGPRRYLMMRTDVLMGSLLRLPPQAQADWLQAWAEATREHGAASLQAYASMAGAEAALLADNTVQAAADLGWGRWAIAAAGDGLRLQVRDSPFVQGWRAAQPARHAPPCTPLCAPISGLFTALAGMLLSSPVQVVETDCAARHEAPLGMCTFEARRVPP